MDEEALSSSIFFQGIYYYNNNNNIVIRSFQYKIHNSTTNNQYIHIRMYTLCVIRIYIHKINTEYIYGAYLLFFIKTTENVASNLLSIKPLFEPQSY